MSDSAASGDQANAGVTDLTDHGAPVAGPADAPQSLDADSLRHASTDQLVRLPAHLILRAAAGTGKTYQLTTRYVSLLERDVEPDQILATTFTRKAAGEILSRVLARLAEDAFQDRRRLPQLQRLCRSLHRVAISTLDSFFARIASCFRLELDLAPETLITHDADPIVQELRLDAVDAVLADEDVGVLITLMRRLHHDHARQSVARALAGTVASLETTYRQAPDPALWNRLEFEDQRINEDRRRRLVELLFDPEQAAKTKADQPNKKYVDAMRKAGHCVNKHRWRDLLDQSLISAAMRDEPYSGAALPGPLKEACVALGRHAVSVCLHEHAEAVRAMHDLMRRYETRFEALKRERGVLLFSDLPQGLAQRLAEADPETWHDVYYRLDGRIRHLLLDEFQDTDLRQYAVLDPIAQEIAVSDDDQRSLFCVGDGKQAIYGWRGGVAEIFQTLEDRLPAEYLNVRNLTTSWRSSPVVLEAVDTVFSGLGSRPSLSPYASAVEAWGRGYERHVAQFPDRPGFLEICDLDDTASARRRGEDDADELGGASPSSAPTFNGPDEQEAPDERVDLEGSVDTRQETAEPADTRYARNLAAYVRELHQRSPGRTIGVLTRTNARASSLLAAMKAEGLDVSGEGKGALNDDPAVRAILSALRLADHPGDTVASYHVARSPLGSICGLVDPTAKTTRSPAMWAAEVRRRLLAEGAATVLLEWAGPLARLGDARNAARLTQLLETIDTLSPELIERPSRLADSIQTAEIEEPTAADIRVMTIHQSKGLEFDLVVLAGLERLWNQSGQTPLVLIDRPVPTGPIRGVLPFLKKGLLRSHAHRVERALEQTRHALATDELCNLYVAMTRARHALHVAAPRSTPDPVRTASGTPRKEPVVSSMRLVLDAFGVDVDPAAEEPLRVLHRQGDPDWPNATSEAQDVQDAEPGRASSEAASEHDADTSLEDEDRGAGADVGQTATGDGPIPCESSERGAASMKLRLAAPGRRRRSWPRTRPSQAEGQDEFSVQASDLLPLTDPEAMSQGEAIHRLFERLAWLPDPSEPATERALQALQNEMAAERDPASAAAGEQAIADVREILGRPAIAELFRPPTSVARTRGEPDPASLELWREKRFIWRDDDRLVQGAFDRVVIHRDPLTGVARGAELIDFKTDTQRRDQHYAPQLRTYIHALCDMLELPPEKIEAKLAYVRLGEVARLEAD